MKAVVLVGGFGTRLRPLTLNRPKPLLPIVHRSMIERSVASLSAHGVDEVVLAIGFRPDAFEAAFPDGEASGLALHYAVEPEPLDTAGAIRFAASDAGVDETFLVLNGDIVTDLDLEVLLDLHRSAGAEATISLTEVEDPSRFGVVPITAQGRVEAFIEKPPAAEAPSRWINAGTYVMEPSVLDRIPANRPVSIERETFPALVADRSLYALQSDAYWVDAGTPDTYLRANLDLADGVRGHEPACHPDAQINRGADVRHSVIGPDAIVEVGATVVDSLILTGARIGAGAGVSGSIVGRRAHVMPGADVGELTVIGDDVEVAAGVEHRRARLPSA